MRLVRESTLVVLLLIASACDAAPLAVAHNQRPGLGCRLGVEGAGGTTSGTFDLVIGDRDTYVLTPLVENGTAEAVEIVSAHVELDWELEGDLVRLRIVCPGGGLCDEWELETCAGGSCPVLAARGGTVIEVPALPRSVTAYFLGLMDAAVAEGRAPPELRVVSRVVLRGRTASGRDVESGEYAHDLRVCLGCLVEFPPGSDSPLIDGPDCCASGEPLPACYPGQDDPVDCRRCIRTVPEICNFGRLGCG